MSGRDAMRGFGFMAASVMGAAAALAAREGRFHDALTMHPDKVERALRGHAADQGKSLDDPEFADLRAEIVKLREEWAMDGAALIEQQRQLRAEADRRVEREIAASKVITAAADAKRARKNARRAALARPTPSASREVTAP